MTGSEHGGSGIGTHFKRVAAGDAGWFGGETTHRAAQSVDDTPFYVMNNPGRQLLVRESCSIGA
jgi:hypothetical protein